MHGQAILERMDSAIDVLLPHANDEPSREEVERELVGMIGQMCESFLAIVHQNHELQRRVNRLEARLGVR